MKPTKKLRILSMERWQKEDGATAVEYGLLVGLIAVFLITAMSQLGDSVSNTFKETACKVSGDIWSDTNQTCTKRP